MCYFVRAGHIYCLPLFNISVLYYYSFFPNYRSEVIILSGRAVASPDLGMVLVFMGFGHFQVSETVIKQTQNVKLMREMQSTGQTESIRCLQMCLRARGRISEKPHIFLSSSFFLYPCA